MDDVVLNNLTPKAEQVLALARREAGRLNHNYLGTEHLLLAVIKLGESIAVDVLKSFGIKLDTLKKEIEKRTGIGHNKQILEKIPYTPSVKKVLGLAVKEAETLNHTYVATEHILLGILHEGDGLAWRVLKDMGVEFEKARQYVFEILDPDSKKPETDPEVKNSEVQKEKVGSSDKGFDGLVVEIMIQSLHENISLEQLKLWYKILEKINEGKSGITIYLHLQGLFFSTTHGSLAERNIGALLQMWTNAPVPRTIKTDFLAMWPKEEREEKPSQPENPQDPQT